MMPVTNNSSVNSPANISLKTGMALALCLVLMCLGACKEEKTAAEASATSSQAASVDAVSSDMTSGMVAAPPVHTFSYQCGDTVVQLTPVMEEKADMRIENSSYAMQRVITASGAKYENLGDPKTYFWGKGEQASVSVNGTMLPDCMEIADTKKPKKPYKAYGNEPGWNASVENDTLTLTADYGDVTRALPVTSDETAENIRTVIAGGEDEKITMTIREESCNDVMSGEAFADRVTVVYGAKTYEGCGRSLVRETVWRLEDLNNAGIVESSNITLTFGRDGRLYGSAGCNNYNGSYTLEGDNLAIKPDIASTLRACFADAMMQQEQKFLQTLPRMTRAALDSTGALVLSGDGAERLVFHRVD